MAIGRIGTRAAFAALSRRGLRARHGVVRVLFVPGDPDALPPVRAAYAIGRPVGTAVIRNRVRRRLRAALTELAPPAGSYLVAATPAAAGAGYDQLRADLAAAIAALPTAPAPKPVAAGSR